MKGPLAMTLSLTLLLTGCGTLENYTGWDITGPDSSRLPRKRLPIIKCAT